MTRYVTPMRVHATLVSEIGFLPRPLTPETARAYFQRRAAACLEIAENIVNLAEAVNEDHHNDARSEVVAELLTEAYELMAEYQHIESMRTRKT